MLCKMLVTRGRGERCEQTLGKAGHQAMLCKMLVTRGKMRTNAGQGWTPGNAMQHAGGEGKDANKRWARLDTRQCYAMLVTRGKMRTNAGQGWTPGNAMQHAGDKGKDVNKLWARLDTRQCYARCW